jgi:hypothetical protein
MQLTPEQKKEEEQKLGEKFAQLAKKQRENEDKIFLCFYKPDGKTYKLHYVWNIDETELHLIAADAIYSGGYDPEEETIPDDQDLLTFTLGEFWGGEGDHSQLESILDQCLRNTPRTWQFVHVNFVNPETDYSMGRSAYYISIGDAIDSQTPFDEQQFDQMLEESRKRHEAEMAAMSPAERFFYEKYESTIGNNSDLYMSVSLAIKHADGKLGVALQKLNSMLWNWKHDPAYVVDSARITRLEEIIQEVEQFK